MVNLPSWPPVAIWQKEKRSDLELAKTLLARSEERRVGKECRL